jgi:membrane-bound lytic murein transglycosylase B
VSKRAVRCIGAALACALLALSPIAHAGTAASKSRAATAVPSYDRRADVRAFIDQMVAAHGFDRRELGRIFATAHFQPKIVEAMQRPLLEPPKWYEYAPQFLSAKRIDGGVAFWREHEPALLRAQEQFGVPPEIVVAIIGVETFYGRNTGRHRVIDALSTLAFDYPRRAAFFRGELESFLLLSRDAGVPATQAKGSFAGAIGLPQFMPGSYRNFAVDFDGDGRVDLWDSAEDAIGSVANFLLRHDWERDQPVLMRASIDDAHRDAVLRRLDGGISERRALDAWNADGVTALDAPPDLASDPVGLLMLEESGLAGDASYWIAANNFYVITRYNRSRLYAASVWQLSRALREAYASATGASPSPVTSSR